MWILLSPLEFKIDTRVPVIMIRWKSIGNAMLSYENEEWVLKIRVLFFFKMWDLEEMIFSDKKKRKRTNKSRPKKNGRKRKTISKVFKILKTFRIVRWEITFCADDLTLNAYYYWLGFFPLTRQHVHINFMDKNYLVLGIRNRIWRMAYAFIK
jgi:hypothetical protein